MIALNKQIVQREGLFVFGELGLDGKVKSSSMLFPTILSLKEQGLISKAIVPKEAIEYLKFITDIEFIPVDTLSDAIEVVSGNNNVFMAETFEYSSQSIEIDGKRYYYDEKYDGDFFDIKGQHIAKRACLIAASGMHNFLMEGSPGCGKSMAVKRLKSVLPPLGQNELLSIAKHQFLDGQMPLFDAVRPIRPPHHTATSASIFGGGSSQAKIGEVALAHNGILFFDELPHFSKNILEALREPMQDRRVHIARVNKKIAYESDIMFVGAMNPCPCGNLLSKSRACRCSDIEIKRYQNRLSDPFLDRIDIFVTMQEVNKDDRSDIRSKDIHANVLKAFMRQKSRGQARLNGKLKEEEIEIYCVLDDDAKNILESAVMKFALSHRSIASIKKVARTIADIEGHNNIAKSDILEALSYRRRKR